MATRHVLKEEFLTCIVCHEVFRDPVTLHCGHTFCTQCVAAYTRTQKQAIVDGCISCPHCRGTTKVPKPKEPVEEWAGQIKTGFFVKGLVERFTTQPGLDDDDDDCSLCKDDGERNPATVWCSDCGHTLCSNCQKVHGKLHKQHHVVEMSATDGQIQKRTRKKHVMCSEHPNAEIDMYCQDCDKAVCQKCCIEYHRKCEVVIALSKAIADIDKILKSRKTEIGKRVQDADKWITGTKAQIEKIETSFKEIESEIDSSSAELIAEIQRQQKQLKDGLRVKKKESLQQLMAARKTEELSQEMDHQRLAFLDQALSSPSEMDHYDLYKSTRNTEVSSDVRSALKTYSSWNYEFDSNAHFLLSSLRGVRLGNIKTPQYPVIGPKSKPRVSGCVDLKKSTETSIEIEDILVFTSGGESVVLVSDSANNCIKSFVAKGKDLSKFNYLSYDNSPDNLTQISPSQAATSFRSAKQIGIFHVIPKLTKDRVINTKCKYSGLTLLSPSTLAASSVQGLFAEPAKVDILDMSGTILRSLDVVLGLRSPYYLSLLPDGDILVSDSGTQTLTRVSSGGGVKFGYTSNDTDLHGVKSHKGYIFWISERKSKVIQLNEDGNFIRNILSTDVDDRLSLPRAIDIDEHNTMYVSSGRRYVRIYEFE